ncbi:MAG: hypothetical protein LBQ32_10975, partial [Burkholderiaceae bacterium]|nr:hypothetical protein [Burkholderiaceae bacterium]
MNKYLLGGDMNKVGERIATNAANKATHREGGFGGVWRGLGARMSAFVGQAPHAARVQGGEPSVVQSTRHRLPAIMWARCAMLAALALPAWAFGETLTNQTIGGVTYDIVFIVRDNSTEPAFPVSGGTGGNTTPMLATQADCVTASVTGGPLIAGKDSNVGVPYEKSDNPRNTDAGFAATGIAQGRCTLTSALMAANWYMAQNPSGKKVLITFPAPQTTGDSLGINPTILPGQLPQCTGSNTPPACNWNGNYTPAYPGDPTREIYIGVNPGAMPASQMNQAGTGSGYYLNGQNLQQAYNQFQFGQSMVVWT